MKKQQKKGYVLYKLLKPVAYILLHLVVAPSAGFVLIFEKRFLNFPNENNHKTDLKCCPPLLGDNENISH